MNDETAATDRREECEPDHRTGAHNDLRDWSVERVIALLDAAIESAGERLARSAGLWDDTPSQALARRTGRKVAPQREASSARSLLDDSIDAHDLELP
ncbi:hypothetical protein E0H73_39985 [Kribbella pittospori]|uniref:Uncharacterized protein n=1 Tax=Kribbella pittospori TaxID=722689 RepID=A0A4R0JZ27_9ACTN|nr:hypothetical protein [Kribbella pittospori]TCC52120.1 hypothetical protein E0H73_39985 [Kribbella pittospori]